MKFSNSLAGSYSRKLTRVLYNVADLNEYRVLKITSTTVSRYLKNKVEHTPFAGVVKLNHMRLTNVEEPQYMRSYDDDKKIILVKTESKLDLRKKDLLKQRNELADELGSPILPLNCSSSKLDTNFLQKERIYAKLKYSRSPQYDIVSGGVAAIFSGFLGFLICEKFGLELLDSGDFYMAFMYGVFIVFACRPLLRVVNGFRKNELYTPNCSVLSLQPLLHFYANLVKLLLKLFK